MFSKQYMLAMYMGHSKCGSCQVSIANSHRKLSDLDEDGHLTFKEFTVAMHLLFIAKLGYYLPVDLDPNTILPPSVSVSSSSNKFLDFRTRS